MLNTVPATTTRALRTLHTSLLQQPSKAALLPQLTRPFSSTPAAYHGPSPTTPITPLYGYPDIQREYDLSEVSRPIAHPQATKHQKAQQIATGQIPRMTLHSVGNRQNEPPQHEMVYFPDLLKRERRFGDFRTVLHTGLYSQVVAMEVPVDGEIGDEVHTVDQILLFTAGRGLATIQGRDQEVKAGDVVVVPAGTQHQFITQGNQPLELLTIYSPAEHAPTSVHKTKEEGDQAEEQGKDEAPAWSRRAKKENEDAGLVRLDAKYD